MPSEATVVREDHTLSTFTVGKIRAIVDAKKDGPPPRVAKLEALTAHRMTDSKGKVTITDSESWRPIPPADIDDIIILGKMLEQEFRKPKQEPTS